MAAAAVLCGLRLSLPAALAVWTGIAAAACAAGTALLVLQPVGELTLAGRIGGSFVYWGFRIGDGRLWPAVLVSFLIWTFLGAAVIAPTQHRSQPQHVLMLLAWAVDGAALLYTVGVALTNRIGGRPVPGSLYLLASVLVAVLVGSAALWLFGESARAQTTALVVAGAPALLAGVGYGVVEAGG